MKQAVKHLGALVMTLALLLGLIASTGITVSEVQAADTTALTVDTPLELSFSAVGDSVILTFTPTETALYAFTSELDNSGGSSDTRIYYNIYQGNDYIGYGYGYAASGKTNSATGYIILDAGVTYTLYVTLYYSVPDSCTLTVSRQSVTDISSGSYSTTLTGTTGYTFLSYTAPESGLYTVSASGTIDASDSYMDVYAISYAAPWEDISYIDTGAYYKETSFEETDVIAMEAGDTIYIRLSSSAGDDDSSATVSLTVSKMDVTADISSAGTYSAAGSGDCKETCYLSYTPSETGVYTFTLSGSASAENSDKMAYADIDVYDSSWGYVSSLYSSQDESSGSLSDSDSAVLEAGKTYYIVYKIRATDDATINSTLTITKNTIIDITQSGSYNVSLSGNSDASSESETYFSYTPSETGYYVLSYSGTYTIIDSNSSGGADVDAILYEADGNSLTQAYDSEGTSGNTTTLYDTGYAYLTAGETYYIILEQYTYNASLSGTLEIQKAADISGTGTYSFSTDSYSSVSVHVSYTPAVSGTYTFTTSVTVGESGHYLSYTVEVDDADFTATKVAGYSGTSDATSYEDVATMELTGGETYYIYLYGYSSSCYASYNFSVTLTEASSCTHSYTSEVTTEATCTEDGILTYTCSLCGDTYTEAIAATGHTWDEGVVTKEATCSEEGVMTYTCTVCGETYTEAIEKTEHTYGDGVVTDPTCTLDGYTTYTCSVCGESYTTNTVAATGHTFGEWTTVSSPTCTETGSQERTCTVCGYTETADIDATGHTAADDYTIDVEATCTTDGSKSIKCTVCGATIESVVIPATGHTWDEGTVTAAPTCTEEGVTTYTCTVCGETKTEAIAATGHTWDEGTVTAEPTCTEEGVTTYTCTVCGETKTEAIAATGHDWDYDSGVVTKEATADEEGIMTYTCRNDSSHTLDVSIACLNDVAELEEAAEEAADDLAVLQADETYSSEAYAQALESYAAALAYAQWVLADAYASTEEVETALLALADAQTLVAAVQAAENAVTAGAELSESDYTAESWAAYAEALSELQALLNSSDATAEEIEAATAALTAAQAALDAAETSDSDSESGSDSDSDSSVDAAETSDAFPAGGYLALMLAACGALLLLLRRRAH